MNLELTLALESMTAKKTRKNAVTNREQENIHWQISQDSVDFRLIWVGFGFDIDVSTSRDLMKSV